MLLDDKEKFVELCIENILWGNLKFDFTHAEQSQLTTKEIVELAGKMGKWIRLRENKESDEFKKFTNDLYPSLLGARFSNDLQGELIDRETEKEVRQLREENTKLKKDNEVAVQNLFQTKEEIDLLKSGKPLDKNFKGFT